MIVELPESVRGLVRRVGRSIGRECASAALEHVWGERTATHPLTELLCVYNGVSFSDWIASSCAYGQYGITYFLGLDFPREGLGLVESVDAFPLLRDRRMLIFARCDGPWAYIVDERGSVYYSSLSRQMGDGYSLDIETTGCDLGQFVAGLEPKFD